jgi:hypothetical protein
MSRKFVLIALGTMMSAPALAQGQTGVVAGIRGRGTPLDTMRAMLQKRNPTVEEVRMFAAETRKTEEQLKGLVEKLNRERVNAAGMSRAELDTEYREAIEEFLGRQRTLLQMCSLIQPHQGESEGVLGFQLDLANIAVGFVRGPGNAKEERFLRAPEIGFVEPGSPAAKADVRPGDVWVAIAGRDIANSLVRELSPAIKPGSRVELKLRRDGRDVNVEVMAQKRPEFPADDCDESRVMTFLPGSSPRVQLFHGGPPPAAMQGFFTTKISKSMIGGAVFGDLTNEKRSALNAPLNEGVLVDDITPGSAAELAGLREFDVVTRVNNEVIDSVSDLSRVTRQVSGPISLWVYRKGVGQKVTLPAVR